MNNMKLILLKMLELQNKLNVYTNGEDWKNGFNRLKNELTWLRYAKMELVEAIESFQYKHWKGNEETAQYSIIDLNNLKVELVDAWHFYMSEIIANGLEDSLDIVYNYEFQKIELGKKYIEAIEELEYNTNKYERKEEKLETIIFQFWDLALSIMTIEEFESLYISKNALNIFRQENGYAQNKYIKIWEINKKKREDNEFLQDYLKENAGKKLELNNILAYLGEIYKSIKI